MNIQGILGAFLSAHHNHEAAAKAYASVTRNEWVSLADLAIRTAPEYNRTHVAQVVKLALDSPENDGPGDAADFEIRKEQHPLSDAAIYRAYRADEFLGLAHHDVAPLLRRLVGMYVVRFCSLPDGRIYGQ